MRSGSLSRRIRLSLFTALVATGVLLVTGLFAAVRIVRLKDLSNLSLEVVTSWKDVDIYTSDILLKDQSQYATPEITVDEFRQAWPGRRAVFENRFTELVEHPLIRNLGPEAAEALRLAQTMKVFTWLRLERTDAALDELAASPLGERLILNRLIVTFFGLRMTGNITSEQIRLVMSVIEELNVLDITSERFVNSLRALNDAVSRSVERNVRRVIIGSVILVAVLVAASVAVLLAARRVARVEEERYRFEEGSRRTAYEQLARDGVPWPQSTAIDPERPLLVGVMLLDDYEEYCRRTTVEVRDSHFRRLETITASRLSDAGFPAEACRTREDGVLLLLNVPVAEDDQEGIMPGMEGGIRSAFQAVADRLAVFGITASVAFSGPIVNYRYSGEVKDALDEAADATSQRFYSGAGTLVFAGRTPRNSSAAYVYPEETDRLLSDAVRLGDAERACQLCEQILDQAVGYSGAVVHLATARVGSTLSAVLHALEPVVGGDFCRDASKPLARLSTLETKAAVMHAIHDVLDRVVEALSDHRARRHEELVTRVLEIVRAEMHDPNLSLTAIADRVDLSAHHLGRVFKTRIGHSVGQEINATRLDRAAELIKQNPDLSVAEAAETVGITNTGYFFTLFKKRFGMTPGEYREHWSVGDEQLAGEGR